MVDHIRYRDGWHTFVEDGEIRTSLSSNSDIQHNICPPSGDFLTATAQCSCLKDRLLPPSQEISTRCEKRGKENTSITHDAPEEGRPVLL